MRSTARAILFLATLGGCAHGGPAPTGGGAPAPAATSALKASGTNRVFRGPEGQRASLVYLEPVDDGRLLIRFDGTGSAWDGKVFMHKLRAYDDKEDYVTQMSGGEYVTITMRYHQYELYPPNRESSIVIQYSDADSQKLDPAQVIAAFETQNAKK